MVDLSVRPKMALPSGPLASGPLYAARKKIYPRSVDGFFRRLKWAILVVTLGVYYGLPFVRWERGPNEPTQAVLVDLVHRRFYFFFIEIWPQEVYYFTGLLIMAALILFLMNALAGRIWCGYLCPQTVWTDLFMMVERWAEGDRRERMRKDAGPWTMQRVAEKVLKHSLWLMIAWWTGGAWVLYFADAPTLVHQLATFSAPPAAWTWIAILTFTTYVLAGHMREQVCLYMCPWPRIQAALTDENAFNVTYRTDLGEPRMSLKKAAAVRAAGAPAGDCVDCDQCVVVCPTGVDIREGSQLGCIQCGLCIDACADVMTRLDAKTPTGEPVRLIGYDTDVNIRLRQEGKPEVFRLIRARTVLYAVMIAAVGGIMLWALLTRADSGLAAQHDRNPHYVVLSDGSVRNGYTLRFANKQPVVRRFFLTIDTGADRRLHDARLDVPGLSQAGGGPLIVEVGPDTTMEIRALVTRPAMGAKAGSGAGEMVSLPVDFVATDDKGVQARVHDFFKMPVPVGHSAEHGESKQ